jgi:hypothetical protein
MMEKFGWVWRVREDGQKMNQRFLDVGLDPATGELHNPNRYDVTEVRRAIAKFVERLDRDYAAKGCSKYWDDRR